MSTFLHDTGLNKETLKEICLCRIIIERGVSTSKENHEDDKGKLFANEDVIDNIYFSPTCICDIFSVKNNVC